MSGAGVNISPVAFLIAKDGNIKLLTVEADRPIDKLVDYVPDIINKVSNIAEKTISKPKKVNIEQ